MVHVVWDYVALVLQAGTGAVALWALFRLQALRSVYDDRRLLRLEWFFGVFAVAVLLQLLITGDHLFHAGDAFRRPLGGAERGNLSLQQFDGHRPLGRPRPSFLHIAHHVFMVVALGIGVRAFTRVQPRKGAGDEGDGSGGSASRGSEEDGAMSEPGAKAFQFGGGVAGGGALFSAFGLLRLSEAALTLYLLVSTTMNAWERRSAGAWRVAGGFLLFFLGHAGFWFLDPSTGPRPVLGEAFTFLGLLLLASSLPAVPRFGLDGRGEA